MKADTFGLQYNGECFVDKSWESTPERNYERFGKGPAAQCQNPLGGTWTNMVYLRTLPFDDWDHIGCFEVDKRLGHPLNYHLGRVNSRQECQHRAQARQMNIIGLAFDNQCYATFTSSKFTGWG